MKLAFLALLFAALTFGQVAVNIPTLTLSADAETVLYTWMTEQQGATTFLSAACSDSDTTITVENSGTIDAEASDLLLIGKEVMAVTDVKGQTLTVTRAQLGTRAASHRGPSQSKDQDGKLFMAHVGDLVTVLKYNTPSAAIRRWIVDRMADLLSAKAQQDAARSVTATKDAAIVGAVQ